MAMHPPSAPTERDLESCLQGMRVIMLGYAKAGVSALDSALTAAPENPGDELAHVQVLLNVVLHNFWRAQRQVSQPLANQAGSWLERHDTAERTRWLGRYRDSSDLAFRTVGWAGEHPEGLFFSCEFDSS